MKTYVVTGGAGFIGSHLIEKLLKQGKRIINIDNFNDYYEKKLKIDNVKISTGNEKINVSNLNELKSKVSSNNYILETVDIRDLEALERIFAVNEIDTVIHLAARAGVRPSLEDPILYQEVNGRGTQNILECCRKYDVKNIVAASSSSVYGNNKVVPFKETDIVDYAISPYAATKKANEVMGHVYHELFNISIAFLRFFTVYGPRQRPDLAINKFTRLILNDEKIPMYGDGNTSRDYTYVADIVDGILKSIEFVEKNEKVFEVFNIGSNNPVSLKEMIETIEKVLGKKAKINRLPMQPGDVDRTYADISKLKEKTGYNSTMSFENGIKEFVQWYKQN